MSWGVTTYYGLEMSDQTLDIDQVRVRVLPDGRVDRPNAARFLGKAEQTLRNWTCNGKGPPSFLVGGRRYYRLDDLKRFAGGRGDDQP